VEVEYRRRDDEGGGWPGTNQDALLAINSLPAVAPDECTALDLGNVVLIGHSAGGCLVLWLAAQQLNVGLSLVVAVAPVCDLNEAYHLHVSDEGDAVERYMKCTPENEDGLAQYASASPAELISDIKVSRACMPQGVFGWDAQPNGMNSGNGARGGEGASTRNCRTTRVGPPTRRS